MADICIYGNPVLRKKAKLVTEFNDELQDFIEEMTEDMYTKDGIGLAAPQVGRSVRLIIVDHTGGEDAPHVLINPEITDFSEEEIDYEEGCLSIPDINLVVKRPGVISVKALNRDGCEIVFKDVDGLFARVLQHEIDHLNGIMFVDRASPVRRQLISGKLKKLAKQYKNITKNP